VHELQAHGHCEELPLVPLTEAAVQAYLAHRFPGMAVSTELSSAVNRRTDGNPLFLTNIVNYLIEQNAIFADIENRIITSDLQTVEHAAPTNLRLLIEQQLERLDTQSQDLLEVASVVGVEFSVAAVAVGLQQPLESVEEVCEQLARRGQFVVAQGVEEWPNGVVSGRYRFTHGLYLSVLYERLAPVSRVQFHRRIAEQKAAAYGARVGERCIIIASQEQVPINGMLTRRP
jgi:predicted ATPase